MQTYQTAKLADLVGVHPNTVRLYEAWGLIPPAERRANGYRVFTERHLAQFRLARLAFQIEVLQNGLRRQIVEVVKTAAAGDYPGAVARTERYLDQVRRERQNAAEAVESVERLLAGGAEDGPRLLGRRAAARYLGVSVDALRNWERNGLVDVEGREEGRRVYTEGDLRRLKVVRSLRCANYSMEAILRLMGRLSGGGGADIDAALNTPGPEEDIVSACDRLAVSLRAAEENALVILGMLGEMRKKFG